MKSDALGRQPQSERFFQLAMAYLQSAKNLTADLRDHIESRGWEHACVVYYCSFHAIELFYKATILAKNPAESISSLCHNITKLKDRYGQLYPNVDDRFSSPFDLKFRALRRAAGYDEPPILEDLDDQIYRYMSDKQGRGPHGFHLLTPFFWLRWLTERERQWKDIWYRIRAEKRR